MLPKVIILDMASEMRTKKTNIQRKKEKWRTEWQFDCEPKQSPNLTSSLALILWICTYLGLQKKIYKTESKPFFTFFSFSVSFALPFSQNVNQNIGRAKKKTEQYAFLILTMWVSHLFISVGRLQNLNQLWSFDLTVLNRYCDVMWSHLHQKKKFCPSFKYTNSQNRLESDAARLYYKESNSQKEEKNEQKQKTSNFQPKPLNVEPIAFYWRLF